MRRARIKPTADCYMHAFNKVAGIPGFFPFGQKEKKRFISILRKLERYYVIDVVSYQVMSNHFHLVVHIPMQEPSPEEACERYEKYYRGKRRLIPGSARCASVQKRLRDISAFMHDLQSQFSTWFNDTHGRHGSLWAGRFKSTILQTGIAVWNCVKYVAMNPVRAGLVSDPGKYRFGSWGAWCTTGVHPFKISAVAHLIRAVPWPLKADGIHDVHRHLMRAFRQQTEPASHAAEKKEEHSSCIYEPFSVRLDRKVRYWVDGLAIGSRRFVAAILRDSVQTRTGECGPLISTDRLDAAGSRLSSYRLRR